MSVGTLVQADPTGDTQIRWDSADEASVEIAKAAFDKARKSGHLAYAMTPGGAKGELIREFDPEAEQIMLMPALVGG